MPTHQPHPTSEERKPSRAPARGPDDLEQDKASAAEEQEAEEIDRDEIEALMAIARLDMEAASAYEVAINAVEDKAFGRMLEGFRGDHVRHVEDLTGFARDHGFDVRVTPLDPESSVLVGLVSSVGALDPDAVIEAMLGNEQLTNATYETALWLVTNDDAMAIVQRNREDERRHLEGLLDYASKMSEEE